MKSLKMVFALVTFVLTGGGYLASQLAAMKGNASAFAYQMDQPPVRILAAILLVGAITLALLPDPPVSEENP